MGLEFRVSHGRGVIQGGLCLYPGYGNSRSSEMLLDIYLAECMVSRQKSSLHGHCHEKLISQGFLVF